MVSLENRVKPTATTTPLTVAPAPVDKLTQLRKDPELIFWALVVVLGIWLGRKVPALGDRISMLLFQDSVNTCIKSEDSPIHDMIDDALADSKRLKDIETKLANLEHEQKELTGTVQNMNANIQTFNENMAKIAEQLGKMSAKIEEQNKEIRHIDRQVSEIRGAVIGPEGLSR